MIGILKCPYCKKETSFEVVVQDVITENKSLPAYFFKCYDCDSVISIHFADVLGKIKNIEKKINKL